MAPRFRVQETSGSADLRYKVYVEGQECGGAIPDGAREVEGNLPSAYFVVIANTSYDETRSYTSSRRRVN